MPISPQPPGDRRRPGLPLEENDASAKPGVRATSSVCSLRIVGALDVALLRPGPTRFGDPGFEGDDGGRVGLGFGPSDKGQQLGDVGLVGRLLWRKGGLEIIVSVRKTQPSLACIHGVAAGVLEIDIRSEIENRGIEISIVAAHELRDVLPVLSRADGA